MCGILGEYKEYVAGIITKVDTIRIDVVAGEPLCYVEYLRDCVSSIKIFVLKKMRKETAQRKEILDHVNSVN